ncbi:hypothetical protein LV779_02470 [Streptomyces thinghirensis]|nr:hypothetical protein [Streptomyces thinghirensis]
MVEPRPRPGGPPPTRTREHTWSLSLYRLEDAVGAVLGLAVSVVDVTEQHRAGVEAEAARRRLAAVAGRLRADRHHAGAGPHGARAGRRGRAGPRRHRGRGPAGGRGEVAGAAPWARPSPR